MNAFIIMRAILLLINKFSLVKHLPKEVAFALLAVLLFAILSKGQVNKPPNFRYFAGYTANIKINDDGSGTFRFETKTKSVIQVFGRINNRNPVNCPDFVGQPTFLNSFPEDWLAKYEEYETDVKKFCVRALSFQFRDLSILNAQLVRLGTGQIEQNKEDFTLNLNLKDNTAQSREVDVSITYSVRVPGLVRFDPIDGKQSGSSVTWELGYKGINIQPVEIRGRIKNYRSPNVPKIDEGQQGKHIRGSKNFDPSKSELTADPNELAQKAGTGEAANNVPRGQPGFRERVDFGKQIGYYVREGTGERIPTTKGIIHYSSTGIHIVPVAP